MKWTKSDISDITKLTDTMEKIEEKKRKKNYYRVRKGRQKAEGNVWVFRERMILETERVLVVVRGGVRGGEVVGVGECGEEEE